MFKVYITVVLHLPRISKYWIIAYKYTLKYNQNVIGFLSNLSKYVIF